MAEALNRDLPLLHDLNEGGLSLRRSPVQLVDKHYVGEYGSLLNAELSGFNVVNGCSKDVGWQGCWGSSVSWRSRRQ